MRKLLYLAALAMMASLVMAPAALAQVRGPSGADGSYNCSDFDTQPQAQTYYESQGGLSGTNPADLDDDLDGVACETLPAGPEMGSDNPIVVDEPTANEPANETQYTTPEPAVAVDEPVAPAVVDQPTETVLPDTGGPALLLPAAGLLLATGLIGLRIVRRRS